MGSIDKACISGFLCRLCSEMHRIVIHIYGDQGQRLCLVEKINGYLPITISPTDPLPKTICTTCLRRVEQHYDLLMRLSRIREERFVRLNKRRVEERPIQNLPDVSSPEPSEDEMYHSDNETNRRQPQPDIPLREHALTSSFTSSVLTEQSSADTAESIAQSAVNTDEVAFDTSTYPSNLSQSNDAGDRFESALPVLND
ncbi:uncharacterized protein LOC106084231 [Stomoxys calcitrans]|uniref:ZAD domain-containing protein n=1 Tax=Stomoxys calcitrans TaxID=35570 RepID=A0A1I8PND7_STOCA|nr:uncharacterized protein LOC106084231 [Stomoxys calcitrans]XP_013103239.1 uncharacterized protein LOC106084231 [Stomoxys calcitrans]XP_013103240.1 uncharacterized protein LOC106084231 [Stomoxys calcitrans]XP_013103242.1 uncharacterized protein LOC106084231 [Stomoxys calcitrans]